MRLALFILTLTLSVTAEEAETPLRCTPFGNISVEKAPSGEGLKATTEKATPGILAAILKERHAILRRTNGDVQTLPRISPSTYKDGDYYWTHIPSFSSTKPSILIRHAALDLGAPMLKGEFFECR